MNEPAHDNNTYNKTCVNSKDSGLPVNLPNIARGFVYPFFFFFFFFFWIAWRLYTAYAISKDSARMIRVFAGRTSLIEGFSVRWLRFRATSSYNLRLNPS